jgi:hypothetical protein
VPKEYEHLALFIPDSTAGQFGKSRWSVQQKCQSMYQELTYDRATPQPQDNNELLK